MDGKADQKEDLSPDSDTAELTSNDDTNRQQAGDSSTDSHPADNDDGHEEDSDVLVQRLLAQHEQNNMEGPPSNEETPPAGGDTTTTTTTSQCGDGRGGEDDDDDDDDDDVPTGEEDAGEGEAAFLADFFTNLAAKPPSPEGSLLLEASTDNDNDDGCPELDRDTPKRETAGGSPDPDDEREESEATAATTPDEVDDIDYGDYLELYHRLQAERESLIQHNSQLQTKLLEYFHRQTGDVVGVHPEKQKPASDQEWRYQTEMGVLDELKRQYEHNSELAHQQAEELRHQAQEKLDKAETEWQALAALKQDVAAGALRRRLGRQAAWAEAERMLASERHREIQLTQARLKNIKLRGGVRRLEAACGARGELPDGVEPLYFQQLKFENQKLLEKIEQRNEELLKLQKKIANYVGVLAHMKEKIHHGQTDNRAKRARLSQLEALVSRRRDELTRLKQGRDRARVHAQTLRQRRGLLGDRLLLRDFEDKVDASLRLERDTESLRHRHALELE